METVNLQSKKQESARASLHFHSSLTDGGGGGLLALPSACGFHGRAVYFILTQLLNINYCASKRQDAAAALPP